MSLVKSFLFKGLSPLDHGLLQKIEFSIKSITKLVNSVLPLIPIAFDLIFMNSLPEMILPRGNFTLKRSDLVHKLLKFDILLKVKTVVSDKFESLFDEREN